MKRLLIALAAAVAVSTASAIITDTQLFETSFADFVADDSEEDGSELADHASAPSIAVPYPCADFGEKFLSLDTGETTLWRTNTAPEGNIYFDMALQFNPSATPPELATGDSTKILLYQNADSNVVILAGTSAADRTAKHYETATQVAPGTWARVSVSSELGSDGYAFKVYVDGNLQTVDGVSSFPSLTDATTIDKVGFSGSGALDDFVARTTDPYLNAYTAKIGSGEWCEKYPSYTKALADALIGTPATITISGEADPVDGSAAHPYQIPNAACLKVLQDAVIANPAAGSLHYVQTQNIDMTGVADFYGIGWFKSSDSYASLPPGLPSASTSVPFGGVYDGGGFKISNVTLVKHN